MLQQHKPQHVCSPEPAPSETPPAAAAADQKQIINDTTQDAKGQASS